MTTFFTLLITYTAALIVLSWYVSRNESELSYLIAGRDRPWWQIMFSKYAASIGAGWFIAYTGFAYTFGAALGLIIIGAIIGIVLYGYWAVPRIMAVTKDVAYTQADYVYLCTKSIVAREFLNAGVSAGVILTLLIAIVGAATLMETYGFMSYELAVLFTIVVVVGYIPSLPRMLCIGENERRKAWKP